MLVTSIFFFSHNGFKRLFPSVHQKSSLCGNGLTWRLITRMVTNSVFVIWIKEKKFEHKTNTFFISMGYENKAVGN